MSGDIGLTVTFGITGPGTLPAYKVGTHEIQVEKASGAEDNPDTKDVDESKTLVTKTVPTWSEPVSVVCKPWTLRHITSYSESIGGSDVTLGLPNYPYTETRTFDVLGAYRTFNISGTRIDSEEQISNFEFVHRELNYLGKDDYGNIEVGIGLMYLTSNLQVTRIGSVVKVEEAGDDRCLECGDGVMAYCMVTGVNVTFPTATPGTMNYTITAMEKRRYGTKAYQASNGKTALADLDRQMALKGDRRR